MICANCGSDRLKWEEGYGFTGVVGPDGVAECDSWHGWRCLGCDAFDEVCEQPEPPEMDVPPLPDEEPDLLADLLNLADFWADQIEVRERAAYHGIRLPVLSDRPPLALSGVSAEAERRMRGELS